MVAQQRFRRSSTEKSVAITVTVLSLALLLWVAFDLFNSNLFKAPTANATQVRDLAQRAQPIVETTNAIDVSEVAPDMVDTPAVPLTVPAVPSVEQAQIEPSVTMLQVGKSAEQEAASRQINELFRELEDTRNSLQLARDEAQALREESAQTAQQMSAISQTAADQISSLEQQLQELQTVNDKLRNEVNTSNQALSATRQRGNALAQQLAALQSQLTSEDDEANTIVEQQDAAQTAYRQGAFREAAQIWSELADLGDPRAKFHLGSLAFEGRLGEVDRPAAYQLLTEAIAGGFGPALAMRARVRDAMTSEELTAIGSNR